MSCTAAKAWRLDFSGRGCSAATKLLGCCICTQIYVINLIITKIMNGGPGQWSHSVSLWHTNGFSSLEEVTLCKFYQRQWKDRGRNQRGEMTRERRPLPALRVLGHDGWFCTQLLDSSSWKYHQLAAEQPLHGQTVRSGKAGVRTVHHSTNHASSPGHAKLIRTPWYYQLAGLDDWVLYHFAWNELLVFTIPLDDSWTEQELQ